jgi:ADP-ribose pyrophosphatase YjhB (NUDIX family)/Txe/YoeB family toxin of Txe-Axe toxin-antitoxin module
MPQAVSQKQYRMMMAILHGKHVKSGPRGRPPKSVAAKYTSPGKDAPEQSGEDRGGIWSDEYHKRYAEKKKKLKKSFEDYYHGKAVATIVMDSQGRILLGKQNSGGLTTAGGHVDATDVNHEVAALRELYEEARIVGRNPQLIYNFKDSGNDVYVYLIESYKGEPKSTEEVKDWKWYEPQDIPWDKLRSCCVEPLKYLVKEKLGKSLKGMLALEALEKNIIRQRHDAVLEVSHGEALKLVGNGLFRRLNEAVKDMSDESFKDIMFDTYTVSIRKHMNDVYSGRVSDGHKVIYHFTNKSLPELTAALMSVFEWYLPEDEKALDLLDPISLPDDVIEGGLHTLIDNYKRHNIGNIYQEMETIREQIRNGMAIDIQQVEGRIMKLFDKLESTVLTIVDKHNALTHQADNEISEIETKLRDLQYKLESLEKKPETIEAFSAKPANPAKVYDEGYPYLPRPQVDIMPNGRIRISFSSDWTSLEKENFLHDLRARAIKKSSPRNDK